MQATSKLNVFKEYIQFRWIPSIRTLIRRDQGQVIDQFQEWAQSCAECDSHDVERVPVSGRRLIDANR